MIWVGTLIVCFSAHRGPPVGIERTSMWTEQIYFYHFGIWGRCLVKENLPQNIPKYCFFFFELSEEFPGDSKTSSNDQIW